MQQSYGQPTHSATYNIVANDNTHVHAGDVNIYHPPAVINKEQQCLRTFKTSTYELYKDRNSPRVEGTCQWVLTHPQFRQWRDSKSNSLLWISADPGCGKSVLAKSLVDRDLLVDEDGSTTICYFFFKDNEEQDNLATALCAILHQIFAQRPDLIHHAVPSWERDGEKLRYETQQMWNILLGVARDPKAPPIICVLDALDECREDDRQSLISLLCNLLDQSMNKRASGNLHFLLTSRPYDNVQRWFEPSVSQWPHIRLRGEDENEQIHQEIDLVIGMRVQELGDEFALSDDSRNRLRDQLLRMRHRTYLWLYLAMDEVRETYQTSLYPDEVVISSLPPSVEDAYERLLRRISSKQQPTARQVLRIIVGARRPLRLGEMAWALGSYNHKYSENKSLRAPCVEHLEKQIRHWCGLFVFIQKSSLYLIHQTAKEFLLSDGSGLLHDPCKWRASFVPQDVELGMAQLCTTFLLAAPSAVIEQMTAIELMPIEKRIAIRDDLKQPKDKSSDDTIHISADQILFFQYCAEHWPSHFQDDFTARDASLTKKIAALHDAAVDGSHPWFIHFHRLIWDMDSIPTVSKQHIVALHGHWGGLKHLYDKGVLDLDLEDSNNNSALHLAAWQGHLDIVRWLVEKGANVDAQGRSENTALYMAVNNGHESMAQFLLKAGADVNLTSRSRSTPLQKASELGYEMLVRKIIEKGANVNAKDRSCNTALHLAANGGHEAVVRTLLENGADTHIRGDYDSGTPLHTAAGASEKNPSGEILRMLLDKGADINALNRRGETALHLLAVTGTKALVQMFLDAGAYPHKICRYNWSPIAHAWDRDNIEVAHLLRDFITEMWLVTRL